MSNSEPLLAETHSCCRITLVALAHPLTAMPRRSNMRSSQLAAAAAATADDWQSLCARAEHRDDVHRIKAVSLSTSPSAQSLEMFCFAWSGQPLGICRFRCEDGTEAVFPAFRSNDPVHRIFDIVFEEEEGGAAGVEGVILGIRDSNQGVTSANLALLRSQY